MREFYQLENYKNIGLTGLHSINFESVNNDSSGYQLILSWLLNFTAGSSSVRVNTVLYSNHGNKEKIPSSPLTRATMPCGASVLQENFLEPHPNLTPLPVSQASDMNIISSTDHSGLSSTTRELQVYVSSSNVFSVTPTSPVIISTNVSGSQVSYSELDISKLMLLLNCIK